MGSPPTSSQFVVFPPRSASEDIPQAESVRQFLQDIQDARYSKMRQGLVLIKQSGALCPQQTCPLLHTRGDGASHDHNPGRHLARAPLRCQSGEAQLAAAGTILTHTMPMCYCILGYASIDSGRQAEQHLSHGDKLSTAVLCPVHGCVLQADRNVVASCCNLCGAVFGHAFFGIMSCKSHRTSTVSPWAHNWHPALHNQYTTFSRLPASA